MDWSVIADIAADVTREFASGQKATVGSLLLDCIESTIDSTAAAERWGQDNAYRFSLQFTLAEMTTIPETRSTITYRAATYRIIDHTRSNSAGTITLHMADA